jgi:hypothetical protein
MVKTNQMAVMIQRAGLPQGCIREVRLEIEMMRGLEE